MSELKELIRKVYAEHPHAHIGEMAATVVERTPADKMTGFYEESLRILIGHVLRVDRNANMGNVRDLVEAAQAWADLEKAGAPSKGARKRARDQHQTSPVVDMIRSREWQDTLESRVYLDNGRRAALLGDCTAAQLAEVAAWYRKTGDGYYAKAAEYDGYAQLVADSGKTTLRECPIPGVAA